MKPKRIPALLSLFSWREGLSGEITASEEGELAWKSLDEALELPLVEDLYTLLPLLSNWQPENVPFWGVYRYDQANQLIIDFDFGANASAKPQFVSFSLRS